jgi:hypothetical protein
VVDIDCNWSHKPVTITTLSLALLGMVSVFVLSFAFGFYPANLQANRVWGHRANPGNVLKCANIRDSFDELLAERLQAPLGGRCHLRIGVLVCRYLVYIYIYI